MSTATSPQAQYLTAPPGFTRKQWETFERDGIIFLEDALPNQEIARYTEALDRIAAGGDGPGGRSGGVGSESGIGASSPR